MDFAANNIAVLLIFIIISGNFNLTSQVILVLIEKLVDFSLDLSWNLVTEKFQRFFTGLVHGIVGIVVDMFCSDQFCIGKVVERLLKSKIIRIALVQNKF